MARNPGTFSTLKTTDTSATSLAVGCAVGSTTAAANSGMKVATISIESLTAPSVTTNKLYNVSGSLTWNGAVLATGSTISGTSGKLGKFTGVASMGDSLLSESGTTVTAGSNLFTTAGAITSGQTITGNLFAGSGASLTSIPTSAMSSGNFVATVASGTGITSSATSGNAAATTISLNNTAVTPAAYGATTGASFTVDQQGRLTAAANATITTLGTVTTGVWNAGAVTSSSTISNSFSGAAVLSADFRNSSATGYGLNVQGGGSDAAHYLLQIGTSAGVSKFFVDGSGNTCVGGSNITDGVSAPTIASGFGTSPSIAGKSYAFKVTIGTSPTSSGTVNFGTTFASAPIVVCCQDAGASGGQIVQPFSISTTQVSIQNFSGGTPTNFTAAQVFYVLVRGF